MSTSVLYNGLETQVAVECMCFKEGHIKSPSCCAYNRILPPEIKACFLEYPWLLQSLFLLLFFRLAVSLSLCNIHNVYAVFKHYGFEKVKSKGSHYFTCPHLHRKLALTVSGGCFVFSEASLAFCCKEFKKISFLLQ